MDGSGLITSLEKSERTHRAFKYSARRKGYSFIRDI